jgi:hypothetical protein
MIWREFVRQAVFDVAVPFIAGGIVFLLVGFGTGVIGTTGSSNINITAARVNERATFCVAAAQVALERTGENVEAMDTSQKRTLVEALIPPSEDRRSDTLVKEQCADRL